MRGPKHNVSNHDDYNSIYLSIYLSIYIYIMSVCLSVCLSVCMSVHLSVAAKTYGMIYKLIHLMWTLIIHRSLQTKLNKVEMVPHTSINIYHCTSAYLDFIYCVIYCVMLAVRIVHDDLSECDRGQLGQVVVKWVICWLRMFLFYCNILKVLEQGHDWSLHV